MKIKSKFVSLFILLALFVFSAFAVPAKNLIVRTITFDVTKVKYKDLSNKHPDLLDKTNKNSDHDLIGLEELKKSAVTDKFELFPFGAASFVSSVNDYFNEVTAAKDANLINVNSTFAFVVGDNTQGSFENGKTTPIISGKVMVIPGIEFKIKPQIIEDSFGAAESFKVEYQFLDRQPIKTNIFNEVGMSNTIRIKKNEYLVINYFNEATKTYRFFVVKIDVAKD